MSQEGEKGLGAVRKRENPLRKGNQLRKENLLRKGNLLRKKESKRVRKKTGRKPIKRRKNQIKQTIKSNHLRENRKVIRGGYHDIDDIKAMFDNLDIAHNSLTIDTLLLYDTVLTQERSAWYVSKNNTRYQFTKMTEEFLKEYKEDCATDLRQFNMNCDEVMKKLNEYELKSFVEQRDIFPGITDDYFNYLTGLTVKTNVDNALTELDKLKDLNFNSEAITLKEQFMNSNQNGNDLKLKDMRWELNMSKQNYNLLKNFEEIFSEFYRSGSSGEPLRVSGTNSPDVPLYEGRDLNK